MFCDRRRIAARLHEGIDESRDASSGESIDESSGPRIG
jgi:hypothetical protein